MSDDGAVVNCRRIAAGGEERRDTTGAIYYVHRLSEERRRCPITGPASARVYAIANADTLHAVYSALLANLPISKSHRRNLNNRGIVDDEVEKRRYGTLGAWINRANVSKTLRERFGDALLGVPGFFLHERGYMTMSGIYGMLVPVRAIDGRISALKIRCDDDSRGKYKFFSSANHGGPGPGAPVHVPLGVDCDAKGPWCTVRVTEGELKADAAWLLSGIMTISIPGAELWKPCVAVLKQLMTATESHREIRLAWDMDARDNERVARGLMACASELASIYGWHGIAVESWDKHKGIDDALLEREPIRLHRDHEARRYVERAFYGSAGALMTREEKELILIGAFLGNRRFMDEHRDFAGFHSERAKRLWAAMCSGVEEAERAFDQEGVTPANLATGGPREPIMQSVLDSVRTEGG